MLDKSSQLKPTVEWLLTHRTVLLGGTINPNSIGQIMDQLLSLQQQSSERINLVINSKGGGTVATLMLCDFITTFITAPIRGIALGSCGSAATFVMLCCHERISTPHSQFLIHSSTQDISISLNGTAPEQLEQFLRESKKTDEAVTQLYMDRLTPAAWKREKPTNAERRKFVQQLMARGDQKFDNYLSAEEAVEVGLVTEITNKKLGILPE